MARVQRSVDQQQIFVFQDGPFRRVTEPGLWSIRDKLLDILETFKEQHEAVQDALVLFWP